MTSVAIRRTSGATPSTGYFRCSPPASQGLIVTFSELSPQSIVSAWEQISRFAGRFKRARLAVWSRRALPPGAWRHCPRVGEGRTLTALPGGAS